MTILPLTLIGDTLGQRHRNLNALVEHAFNSDVKFQEIQSISEQSPVDRLFKIDLASRLRDVDYIIKNLKDYDMLYVSRALKCRWLLGGEYQNIINPEYLENDLYPHMTTTAISKMKRWISVNLKGSERCKLFYKYYSSKSNKMALLFLTHCEVSFILDEIQNILDKLDPFYFKLFCEKSPQVAKVFFDSLMTNDKVLNVYLNNKNKFYESLKITLKADSEIFLDIVEKYFDENEFERLSSAATKYIMTNCKDRIMAKIELYAAFLLDIKAMAECFTTEESKEVVTKLAQATYLDHWFDYKKVEPLIKRLKKEERAAFKRKVFVEKDIGDCVQDWPYQKPLNPLKIERTKLFDDDCISFYCPDNNSDYEEDEVEMLCCAKMSLRCEEFRQSVKPFPRKSRTVLDQLFDEYRFASFEKTLTELRKKIAAESSQQNRQYILLVLISKTGGRTESLATLLQLLEKHLNEPTHVRATIVRSLVKRAFVWRLPQESWESFLKFATGLGLDGKPPEAQCREGVHAVVLRTILENGVLAAEIFSAYKKDFSTFKEYSLTPAEKNIVSKGLIQLLQTSIINETNANEQAAVFRHLFQTLNEYKLPLDASVIAPSLSTLAKKDPIVAQTLVLELFRDKKARRELFHENFMYVSTDASYLNALRHNIDVLKVEKYVNRVLEKDSQKEQFYRKLKIYFAEDDGLAELYLAAIKKSVLKEPNMKLARPIAVLMRSKDLQDYLKQLNEVDDKKAKRFSAALAANSHLTKPKLDLGATKWHILGAKAIANRVLTCRKTEIDNYLVNLLKSPRTLKLAVILSQRINAEADVFAAVAKQRPNVALKCAMTYFYRNPDTFNQSVWECVKPIMRSYDFENKSRTHFSKILWKVSRIPTSLKADYCMILFDAAKNISKSKLTFVLSQINKHLIKFNEESVEAILTHFLHNEFKVELVFKYKRHKSNEMCEYLKIFVKFLLLSKSAVTQSTRLETFAEPLLKTLTSIWDRSENKDIFTKYLKEILNTLKYRRINFNEDYVSCLPVFERIVSWMHTILPMEEYFSVYADIHLSMLYFKAARQCLKQRPDVFKDDTRKYVDGIDILGRVFGQYIVKEVDELKKRYFESILELYWEVLRMYLYSNFFWDPLKKEIYMSITKGIAEFGIGTTALLGVYSFNNYVQDDYDSVLTKDIDCIFKEKDNKEVQFFLNCKDCY